MGILGPLLPCRVEQGMLLSLLTRPPQLQEESSSVRIDQEVKKRKATKTATSSQEGIPAGIGMKGSVKVPVT